MKTAATTFGRPTKATTPIRDVINFEFAGKLDLESKDEAVSNLN